MNCPITIPANLNSTLTRNLPEDLNQGRLKDRIPDERKYGNYNHDLSSLMEAPFGVVTAFPNYPNPVFNNPSLSSYRQITSSSQVDLKCDTPKTSNSIMNRPNSIETASIAIHTETEICDTLTETQLTASLWGTEFAIAEFEQKNKNLLIQLNISKVSLLCTNMLKLTRANAKGNADRAESESEIAERMTSDLFEENIEGKHELEEATSTAESLQSELLEANKTNSLPKQKLDSPLEDSKNL